MQYYRQGTSVDDGATFLILVPQVLPTTLAAHQPIIVHGEALRLASSGHILCQASTRLRTRVYTAITSEPELSYSLPTLGLRWLGIHAGFALIASLPRDGASHVSAVPLLIDVAHQAQYTTFSLDIDKCEFPHGEGMDSNQGYAIFSPMSRRVVSVDASRVCLGAQPLGGTCVVSPMYSLPVSDGTTGEAGTWRIALLTPHAVVLSMPEPDAASRIAVASNRTYNAKSEYDGYGSDDDEPWLKQAIHPSKTATSNSFIGTAVSVPRRVVQYVIPLIWRTVTFFLRAILIRLFAFVGMQPPALFVSLLGLSLPQDVGLAERKGIPGKTGIAYSTGVESDGEASEANGPRSTVSEATTEETYASPRPALTFDVSESVLALLAVPAAGLDAKDVTRDLEVLLNGERLPVSAVLLKHGSAVLEAQGKVGGGRVEVMGALAHDPLADF